MSAGLAAWYTRHGRHELPWRATTDPWLVLVSEIMLQQTQVARVLECWPSFVERFPTPSAASGAGPGALIREWGNLGYPRRARRLWEAARILAEAGWPDDLRELPGVGRYTAGALAALARGDDAVAVDANIRRVVERVTGRRLSETGAEAAVVEAAAPLQGRERLLALMDVGALLCRPRSPRCGECPLAPRCATRGVLAGETRSRQAPFPGSFRERRGRVLAALRDGPCSPTRLDAEALASLVDDGLAVVDRNGGGNGTELARLP